MIAKIRNILIGESEPYIKIVVSPIHETNVCEHLEITEWLIDNNATIRYLSFKSYRLNALHSTTPSYPIFNGIPWLHTKNPISNIRSSLNNNNNNKNNEDLCVALIQKHQAYGIQHSNYFLWKNTNVYRSGWKIQFVDFGHREIHNSYLDYGVHVTYLLVKKTE